jgi:hypothetical protein
MYRKIFISFLLLALINFLLGCYSSELVNVTEYKQIEEEDKPDEIRVITKDSQEYHFSESNFYVGNDSLYGKVSVKELSFKGEFAFWEIESIQFQSFDGKNPSLISVTKYQKIETESGKPDEIYLTKHDSTKYHFMKNDYYLENDTLYGKGKLILDKEQLLEIKIAVSEIESIEVESIDGGMTALLVLGILAGLFIGVLAIYAANWNLK